MSLAYFDVMLCTLHPPVASLASPIAGFLVAIVSLIRVPGFCVVMPPSFLHAQGQTSRASIDES